MAGKKNKKDTKRVVDLGLTNNDAITITTMPDSISLRRRNFKSAKMSYAIAKVFMTIEEKLKPYQETRKKLIEDNSERDKDDKPVMMKDGLSIKIKEDCRDHLQVALEELGEIKIEVDAADIDFDKLPDDITPAEICILFKITKQ